MVSQRQRLARKRCRESHPEFFPAAEKTPSEDPDSTKNKKKKIKLSKLQRKKSVTNGIPNKVAKSSLKRHPLRVPGLKPGQGCFICKGQDHIAMLCPERNLSGRKISCHLRYFGDVQVCLLCRRRGHSLKHCPNKDHGSVLDKKMCYNCGETGHSLASCPRPLQDGGTKFASCFICPEPGHLSKHCPQNAHGIYPKGGFCKTCGGVTHLAKDCPDKGRKSLGLLSRSAFEIWETPRPQVAKFVSGHDLDDDFVADKKDTVSSTIGSTGTEGGHEKTKKRVLISSTLLDSHVSLSPNTMLG